MAGSGLFCTLHPAPHLHPPSLTSPHSSPLTLPAPEQFLPFIQGPRNCLGQYFALLEARVILSTLCQVSTAVWHCHTAPWLGASWLDLAAACNQS